MNEKKLMWFGFAAGIVLSLCFLLALFSDGYTVDGVADLTFMFLLLIMPNILISVFSILKKFKVLYLLGLWSLGWGFLMVHEGNNIFIFGLLIFILSLLVFFIPLINDYVIVKNQEG